MFVHHVIRQILHGSTGDQAAFFKNAEFTGYASREWKLLLDQEYGHSCVAIEPDNDIADLVHVVEAFWRAYRRRARFDWSRSFGAWMRRIATNVARDHLRATRRRARWSRAIDDEIAAPGTSDSGVSDSVAQAFRRLAIKLQVVATLALIEERPYAEIADALQLPVGTVKSRVFRAIRALRKELARLGVQP